jgi:hypothetical protein
MTEFGYWPERERGIVERRRRFGRAGQWSEIERLGPKRFVVRSQYGTEHPAVFPTFTKALPAAKDLSFCEHSMAVTMAAFEHARKDELGTNPGKFAGVA